MRSNHVLKLILIILFTGLLLCPTHTLADPNSSNQLELTEGWEYFWGDSPGAAKGKGAWQEYHYPLQPPNPDNHEDVWLRVELPQSSFRDPSIFFVTNDQLFEVYFDGKTIYSFGDVENPLNKSPGSPWHIIPLPEKYAGKHLYFRMHTVFPPNAGLVRTVALGTSANHLEAIIKNYFITFILSILFIFIGFVLFFIYLTRRDLPSAFASLGFFAICFGVWLISETQIKQIFFNSPRFWLYSALGSFYLMPIGFLYFVEHLLIQRRSSFIAKIRMAFITFILLVFALDSFLISPIVFSLKYYYILLVISIVASFSVIARAAQNGDKEARIFLLGFAFLSLFGVYDIFGWYFRVVPWSHFTVQYGMLAFILTLVYLLARRVALVYDQVNESRDKLADWNKALEQTVSARTSSMRNLLDNAGQGFLTFGKNMTINADFSYECTKLFGFNIAGKHFPDIIYPQSLEQRSFLSKLMLKLLEELDILKRQKYLPLLPDEVSINEKCVHVEYKIIKAPGNAEAELIMVILTDITDRRHLESQMEVERNILKMVVKVIAGYNDFIEIVSDYKSFCSRKLNTILKSNRLIGDVYFELFREIHTFKGSFSQFDMVSITEKLHNLEAELINLKAGYQFSIDSLKEFFSQHRLEDYLNSDLDLLKGILGEKFLRQESTLTIDKSKLLEIEKKMLVVLSPYEYNLLLPDIQKLRYRPFKEVLKGYPDYVSKLAERQEKLLYPVQITGGDILVDLDKYSELSKALIHVFRNIIDHGIESPEERIALGKSEHGSIRCSMDVIDSTIRLSVTDDGSGINLNKIRKKAVEFNICSQAEASAMSNTDAMQLIFMDQFSTKELVNELSGRGFGLAAVKAQIDRLGGAVRVDSIEGEGTSFSFDIPFEEGSKLPEISASSIINPIIDTAKQFLIEQVDLKISQFNSLRISQTENVVLREYTSLINFKGVLSGRFVISMDGRLIRSIASSFILGEINPDEEGILMQDALAEFSNIVLGNSIKMFPELENLVILEPPITLSLNDATIRFIQSSTWTCSLECELGSMDISFITADFDNIA